MRVAPSLRSQKGAIWTKERTSFDFWEIDVAFRVSGRGRIGADGLAIWFVTEKGDYNGEVFGSSDKWTGLGIFFDSFDNDNKHNVSLNRIASTLIFLQLQLLVCLLLESLHHGCNQRWHAQF